MELATGDRLGPYEIPVEFLLAHGADRTLRDPEFDSTPEEWAAEGRHDEVRELLRRDVIGHGQNS